MIKIFAAFFLIGLLTTWRSRIALRAYNRRMWPSMQRGPIYLWNLIVFSLIGAFAAGMVFVTTIHIHR